MTPLWQVVLLALAWLVAGWLLWTDRRGAALLFFLLLAVTATWPLAFSLDRLPANAPAANDAFLFLWDLWWVRTALGQLSNPYLCDYLYWPHGTTLVYHALVLPQAIASLPLQAVRDGLAGLVLAYDGVVLASFWLSGWAAYRLAHRVVPDRGGAFLCGTAFTLSSLHFASTVRLHALAMEWLALYLWALLVAFERGRAREGAVLGLAFVGAFHASVEYAYFLLLATLLFGGWELWRHRERVRAHRHHVRTAAGFAATLVLTVPFWLAFLEEGRFTHRPLADHAHALTADVLDVVLPDSRHALLGGPLKELRTSLGLPPVPKAAVGQSLAVGLLALLGLARAVRHRAAHLAPWAALAGASALLMLGPSIRILGRETALPAPFDLARSWLPFFEQTRMPMRFAPLAALGLGVLAAYALQGLRARLGPRGGRALAVAAVAWVAFESLRIPLETVPVEVPEAYHRVAAPAGADALLDWPPGRGVSVEIEGLHQIVHRQRLVQDLPLFLPRVGLENRRTATGPEDFRALVRTLFASDGLREADPDRRHALVERDRRLLDALDLRHVVLRRRDLPPAVYERGREHLLLHGPDRVYEDEEAFLASFAEGDPAAAP